MTAASPDPTTAEARPARHLRVRVRRQGEVRADLTFPAAAAANLVNLLPPGLEERLRQQQVDVPALAARAAASGFAAGDLFVIVADEKEVRVWLE